MARHHQQLSPLEVYRVLLSKYRQQYFSVPDSPFEITVHAVLMQNSGWADADAIVSKLRQEGFLSIESIVTLDADALVESVALEGFTISRAELLKRVIAFYKRYGGGAGMKRWPATSLRALLLKVEGLEPETADAILLFALDKPTVIANSRAKRVFERVGRFESRYDYHEAQEVLMNRLPHDLSLLKSLNSLIQEHGERYCDEAPDCNSCPLDKGCLNPVSVYFP